MVRRRDLLAYLIGAGVAGTVLVGPYTLRTSVASLVPGLPLQQVPFFLLPILWGLWNLLWARRQPRLGIGAWGALLGFVAAVLVNLLFLAEGAWFPAAIVLPVFLPVVYYLLWLLAIGPLNEALGIESNRLEVTDR
jgi:hypothetical protein